jgi:hypothetical protein
MALRRRRSDRCGRWHLFVVVLTIAGVVAPCPLAPAEDTSAPRGDPSAAGGSRGATHPAPWSAPAPLDAAQDESSPERSRSEGTDRDEIERVETTDWMVVRGPRRGLERSRRAILPPPAGVSPGVAGRLTPWAATARSATPASLPTLLCRQLC